MGLFVSGISGFIVGNRITYILFLSFIASLVFALFGFGVHYLLQLKVPEFLELLSGLESGKGASEEIEETSKGTFRSSASTESSPSIDMKVDDSGVEITPQAKDRSKDGKYGDHIIVENITIKNEPKLMAEAIRTMLAKDDDGGG